MISLESPDSDKPNNLPLLTELADGDTLDELPTLTDIITAQTELADDAPQAHADTAVTDTNISIPAEDPAFLFEPSDTTQQHIDPIIPAPPLMSEAQMQQLEQRLAAHFETVFRDKLSLQLEQLQKFALRQAVAELKTELPGLLRDALNDHTKPL